MRRLSTSTFFTIAALVLAACGSSSGDDTAADPADQASPLTVVASGSRWLSASGDQATQSEFDVSAMKTDPEILGVEVWWEFEQVDPDKFLTVLAEISQRIDGQTVQFGLNAPAVRGSNDRTVEDRGVRISPIDGGLRVTYRFSPRGASDLFDDDGNPVAIKSLNISLDFEAGDAGLDTEFFEDRDEQGVLEYQVSLSGELGLSGIDSTVRLVTVESDPDVEAVPDDPDALAALDQADTQEAADQAGCEVDVAEVDGTTLTITSADGNTVLESALPAGWTIEVDPPNDPCSPASITIESPPQDDSRDDLELSLQFRDPYEATLSTEAEVSAVGWNTSYADGNETPVTPDDERYTAFDPIEETTIWGQPAVRLVGRPGENATTTILIQEAWIGAGDDVVSIYYSNFPDTNREELVDVFFTSTTLTVR